MVVKVCTHRSSFCTLWENSRTNVLLQPGQGDFGIGVIQKVVGSRMKPAGHRDCWLFV